MVTYLWPTGTVGRPWTFAPKGEAPEPEPRPDGLYTRLWPTGSVGRPWLFLTKGGEVPPDPEPTETTITLRVGVTMVVLVTVRDPTYPVGDHGYSAPKIRRAFAGRIKREFSSPPRNREFRD